MQMACRRQVGMDALRRSNWEEHMVTSALGTLSAPHACYRKRKGVACEPSITVDMLRPLGSSASPKIRCS